MNTYTTVADVRRGVGSLFNESDFLPYLNQALERITNSGLWKGSIAYAGFPAVDNYFTLPWPYLAVLGANWYKCPVPVFGQFHDFVIGGPGQPFKNQLPAGIVRDLGDGYATTIDPPTAGSTLLIKLDLNIDSGKTFRFYGISNGQIIYDVNGEGMNITATYPSTSESTVFDQVTGIQVPVNADGSSALVGGWKLYSVAPDSTQTLIGQYYPNDARPMYRRYQFGVTQAHDATYPEAVTVLVRRRYMPVFKNTDWVFPGNVGAIKFGMQAIDSESCKNPADQFWSQCYTCLNQELHATRGAARPEMDYSTLGDFSYFYTPH